MPASRPRKLLRNGVLLAVGILAVAGFVFRDEIQGIIYARALLMALAPERIDETFRSMHEQSPSHVARNQGKVLTLEKSLMKEPLPVTFIWKDEVRDSRKLLVDTQTTGLVILHEGKLVYESYDRGNVESSPAIQMSVGKTYTSFLIGTLLDSGAITSKTDLIENYVPSLRGTAFEGVTIEDLLDMASGIRWVEDIGDPSSELFRSVVATATGKHQEFIASLERIEKPGTFHRYATGNMYPLTKLVEAASEQPFRDYFETMLLTGIGAEFPAYLRDDDAMPAVAVRDMARFGQLYLDGGRNLAGDQVISEAWTKVSTRPDKPMLMPGADNPLSSSHHGYKHLWWVPVEWDEDYVALGIYGQFIYVSPKHSTVIAKTSAYQNEFEDGGWRMQETVALFQQTARHLSSRKMATLP